MPYYVYLLECEDGTLYCGYTVNIEKRLFEHNNTDKGAKYTIGRRPVALKYYEIFQSISDALRREHQIKKLSRDEKLDLIQSVSLDLKYLQ